MRKFTLVAITAAILAGCATAPQEPPVTSYSYDSKAHSGTVQVTDKHYSTKAFECPARWREGDVYTPKGIIPMGYDHLNISLVLSADGQEEQAINLNVPQNLGSRVLAKDFQTTKTFMLGAETNGLIQQGEHFSYSDGYFVRISAPAIKGWDFAACIGIDHMYVLDSDLQSSTNPPVYLDRVVVPFAMDQAGQPVKVSFGNKLQHSAEIRVQPNK